MIERVLARRGTVLLAAVLLVLGVHPAATATPLSGPLGLPAPPATPTPTSSPTPVPEELIGQLDAVQRYPQTRPRATVGVVAIDDAGTTLTARGAHRSLLPASTMKLVTAAAALRLFGPDHRFVTRVHATVAPDDTGVVDGDLVIVGGGDPVLATPTFRRRVYSIRPATPLSGLAGRIRRSGITHVTGRVLGDPSRLADQPLAAGWPPSYLETLDTTRSSGLTVDAGLRLFRRSGRLHAAAAADPAQRTARELRRLLRRRKVRIDGAAGATTTSRAGVEVARITSPPLDALLEHMLRFSDNHLADAVFRMLGAATGDPTWRGSARAVRATLEDLDVRWNQVRLADGSGLSRRNRLTPDALVRLLGAMADGPQRDRWLRLLPVAGRSGTLAGRLRDTPAAGRVHAKTGTLRDVRALAGTIPGRDGDDHHLAVLVNELDGAADIAAARRLSDVLSLALAVAQDGCGGPLVVDEPDSRIRDLPERRICRVRRATTQ